MDERGNNQVAWGNYTTNIKVVFYVSSSWVRIRLHTENQLPRLSRTALIVMIPGVVVVVVVVVVVGFLPIIIPPQQKLF